MYDKSAVKNLCFRAFFSRSGQSRDAKRVLKQHFENVVRLCEVINNRSNNIKKHNQLNYRESDPIYSIPQLMQRLESRTLLDIVALKVSDHAMFEFTTIHDSFLCAASEAPLFKFMIEDTFLSLGLPVPVVVVKETEPVEKAEVMKEKKEVEASGVVKIMKN